MLVQRGTVTLGPGSTNATVALGTAVSVGRSFVIISTRSTHYGGSRNMSRAWLKTIIGDEYTELEFRRSSDLETCIVHWQVITGTEFNVQSGEQSFAGPGGIVVKSIILPKPVDLSKAFAIVNSSCNDIQTAYGFVRAHFHNASTLYITVQSASGSQYPIARWQIVEWEGAVCLGGTVWQVDDGSTPGITTVNLPFDVDLSKTFLLFANTSSGSYVANRTMTRGRFSSLSQLEFRREYGLGTNVVSWFVISHPDILVQRGLLNVAGLSGTAALSPVVDMSASFTATPYMGNASCDSGTMALHHGLGTHRLAANNQIEIQRENSTNTLFASWFAVNGNPLAPPTASPEAAVLIGETAAWARGKIVKDGGATCDARVRRRQVGVSAWTTSGWANGLVAGQGFSFHLTGLTPGTDYEYQVQARNTAGEGPWSDFEYFTTKITPDPGPPPKGHPGQVWVYGTRQFKIDHYGDRRKIDAYK